MILKIRDTLKLHIEQDEFKQENCKLQSEALLGTIRDNITRVYHKYLASKNIPSYDKENLVKQYTTYHKIHGSSYVDVIYDEMLE